MDQLRTGRYGVIVMRDERLEAVRLRRWPKLVTVLDAWYFGPRRHRRAAGNRCWLYYNQPWRHANFLVLKYLVSDRRTTLRTLRGALAMLDEIARIKRSDAILCEAANERITDRMMGRWGWERHVAGSWRRHYIKRFYGTYPDSPWRAWLEQRADPPGRPGVRGVALVPTGSLE